VAFDSVPDVYDRIRPRYPARLFDDLFALLPARPRILEVGPGTGQATRDLLRQGATVHAIEIGPAMARKLQEVLPSSDLTVIVGEFERVPDVDEQYDAVVSATAYHWIDSKAQLDRPARLLKPGGVVAVVDLVQVRSTDDHGFFDAAQEIYERHGEGHTGPPAPLRNEIDPPMRQPLERDPRFAGLKVRQYDWNQTYSAAEYRQLMLSYSTTQTMESVARAMLLDDIEAFVNQRFNGVVTRPAVVTLTTATRTN
jgi:SAM-dependent methyltransferase